MLWTLVALSLILWLQGMVYTLVTGVVMQCLLATATFAALVRVHQRSRAA